MKKVFSIVLVVSLALVSLTGCSWFGEGFDQAVNPSTSSDTGSTTSNSAPADESGYQRGTMTSVGFTSEYLHIRYTLPDGYVMATEEDLMGMMDVGADALGVDGDIVDYAKVNTVYEMMATAPAGSPNVIVMAEKLPQSNMTEEEYFEAFKGQMANMGVEGFSFSEEIVSMDIAGQSYKKISAEANMEGQSLLQDYIIRKQGVFLLK